MKLKVVLASAAVVAIAVVAFAFTAKKSTQTFYYISGTDNQRIEPGHSTESDFRERTIDMNLFKDQLNWTSTAQSFTPTSDLTKYVGSISFDQESVADGGSDGQLTLQEALDAVYAQYTAATPDAMQNSFVVDNNAVVTFTAASTPH